MLNNTKQCPQCKLQIEIVSRDSDHMTCRRDAGGCGFEFCWSCCQEWRLHESRIYRDYICYQWSVSSKERFLYFYYQLLRMDEDLDSDIMSILKWLPNYEYLADQDVRQQFINRQTFNAWIKRLEHHEKR